MSAKKYDVRTGVIGVGSMGSNHARVYDKISKLVGIADLDSPQARKIAQLYDVDHYDDYKILVDNVDAVTIAVPTIYHQEVANYVIGQGKSVLVEKPLAENSDSAKSIVDMARRNKVTLAVGHVERHNPVIAHSKKCIEKGEWGEIITFSARRFSNMPERVRDIGVILDLSVHDIDVINYLSGGKVESVFALGGSSMNTEHEDHVILSLNFDNGKIGLCETNWLTPMKTRNLTITTTSHYVTVDYLTQEIEMSHSRYTNLDESNLYMSPLEVLENKFSPKINEPLERELSDFLGAHLDNTSPLVSGEDGVKVIQIVEAAQKSLKQGRVINLL